MDMITCCTGAGQTDHRSRFKKRSSPSVRKTSLLGVKLGLILSSQLAHFSYAGNSNLGCDTSQQGSDMSCTQVDLTNFSATQNSGSAANAYGTQMSYDTSTSTCWESTDGNNAIWEADIPDGVQVKSVAVIRGNCNSCSGGLDNTYVLKYGSNSAEDALYHTGDGTQDQIEGGFWANLSEPAVTKLRIGKISDGDPITICDVYAFSKSNIVPDATITSTNDEGDINIFKTNVLSNTCNDQVNWIVQDLIHPQVQFAFSDLRPINSVAVFACLKSDYNNDPNNIENFSGYKVKSSNIQILSNISPQLEVVFPDNTDYGEQVIIQQMGAGVNFSIGNVMIFMPDSDPCTDSVLTNKDQSFTPMNAFVGYAQTQAFASVEVQLDGTTTTSCGTVSYAFSESGTPYSGLSVDGNGDIALAAPAAGDVGSHQIDVSVTVSDNSALDTTLTNQLTVNVYQLLSGGTISDTLVNVYNSNIAPISYNPFTIDPDSHSFTIDYTMTSTPDASAFVTLDTTNNQLDLTADVSHVGSYTINVVGTVNGFSPEVSMTETFTLTVTQCEVTSIDTDASDHTFNIYAGTIVQDSITFTLTQTPSCDEQPVSNQFEITAPSTESIATDSSGSPWIFQTLGDDKNELTLTINTSSMDKVHDSYTITQTVTLPNPSGNGVDSFSKTFQLSTVDKCATMSINTNGLVQEDVVLFIGQENEVTVQAFDIMLDSAVETRCGNIIYQVLKADGSVFSFLTINSDTRAITLVDPQVSDANIYIDAQLRAYVNIRDTIENIQTFDIRLYNLVSLDAMEKSYSIESPNSMKIDFSSEFAIQPDLDPLDQYQIIYSTSGIDWVTITNTELEFVTDANIQAGDHECILTAKITNSDGVELEGIEASVTITITVSHPVQDQEFTVSLDMPPYFESDPPSTEEVPYGTSQTIEMPARIDEVDASEDITCEAELGSASTFISFDEGDCSFTVSDTTTVENLGDYKVTIQLTNSLGLQSAEYQIIIQIVDKSEEQEQAEEEEEQVEDIQSSTIPITQETTEVVKVDLSRYFISTEDLAQAKEAYKQKLAEISEQDEIEQPKAKIKYVSNAGLLMLDFTKKMIITQEISDMISKRYQGFVQGLIFEDQERLLQEDNALEEEKVIEEPEEQPIEQIVELNPYMQLVLKTQNPDAVTQEDLALKQFTWEIIDFEEDQCNIKLHWINPLYISLKDSVDEMNLQFIDFEFLQDQDGLILDPEITYQKVVPKQMKQDDAAQKLGAVNESMQSGMEGAMIGNFISNMFMSGSLQYLWNMLRAQQLIVHLPLVNVEFPGNAQSFFAFLLKIASFDLFPTDNFYDNTAEMLERPALSPSFEALGYESTYFLRNLGSPFFFAFYMTMALMLIFKFRNSSCIAKYKTVQRYILKLHSSYFWSIPLRFFFENYMILIVCVFIQFTDMIWKDFWTILSSINSIAFLIACLFIIVFTNYLFIKKLHIIFQSLKEGTYFPLHENMHLHVFGPKVALVHSFFFLRRIIMAAILVFFRDSTVWYQTSTLFFTVIAVIISNGLIAPFSTRFKGKIELFNELCITLILYLLLCFTDFIDDLDMQYNLGWIAILINSINIFVNLGMMFYFTLGGILRKLKQKFIIRRELKRADQNKQFYAKKVSFSQIRRKLYMIQDQVQEQERRDGYRSSGSNESSVSSVSNSDGSSDHSIRLDEDDVPVSVERDKPSGQSYSDSNSISSAVNDSVNDRDSFKKQYLHTDQNLSEMMPHAQKKKLIHIEQEGVDFESNEDDIPIRQRNNNKPFNNSDEDFYNTLTNLILNQQVENKEQDEPKLANSPDAYKATPVMVSDQVTYDLSREASQHSQRFQFPQSRSDLLQTIDQQQSISEQSYKADALVDYELNVEEHKVKPVNIIQLQKNPIKDQNKSKDNQKKKPKEQQQSNLLSNNSNPFSRMYNKLKGKLVSDRVQQIQEQNKKALKKALGDNKVSNKQAQKSKALKKNSGGQKPKIVEKLNKQWSPLDQTTNTDNISKNQQDFTNLYSVADVSQDDLQAKQTVTKPVHQQRLNKKSKSLVLK